MSKNSSDSPDPTRRHEFGGSWTRTKLDVLSKYLSAYTTALKNQDFAKHYIDGFAGTGYHDPASVPATEGGKLLFPDLAAPETRELLDGSASLALKSDPPFDRYVFIDSSPKRCASLERLRDEFPDRASRIQIRAADANDAIEELCRLTDWSRTRAVVFLDPYGMQVEWTTIEALARTHAVDLWYLFPCGIGVNRLLRRDGRLPDSWRRAIEKCLGPGDWEKVLYKKGVQKNLFGDHAEQVAKVNVEAIGRFFLDRLRRVFADVLETPIVLTNSSGSPLYLLCFAVANERGAPIAKRIARDLVKNLL